MASSSSVWLEAITADNWRTALEVHVSAEQLRFVADHQPVALVILAKAHVGALERVWEPVAIVSDVGIVGVVGLAHGDDDSVIANLAIDVDHQMNGIGAAGLAAIIAHCAASGRRRLTVTAHPDNRPAAGLYERAGFTATGEMRDGEPEWQLDLQAPPDVAPAADRVIGAEMIAPTVQLHAAWLVAHEEWGSGFHEDGFGVHPTDEVNSEAGFARWVRRLTDASDPSNFGTGESVRCLYRWIVEDDRVLGGIALRYGDVDMVQHMGHIGYGIRPSQRNRGLGTWALGQMIDEARGLGLDRLLVVCEPGNVASAKTIEANGGVLEDGHDHEGDDMRRYWIALHR